MSFRRSKKLLEEMLGKADYQLFIDGDPIIIQSPSKFYTIVRSDRWKVTVESKKRFIKDPFTNKYNVLNVVLDEIPQTTSSFADTFEPITHEYWWNLLSTRSRERTHGVLCSKRSEFYDAVAALTVGLRLDKVNFGCGELSVDLPHTVPPKDMSVLTYIGRGIGRIYRRIIDLPDAFRDRVREGANNLVTCETSDLAVYFIINWVVTILLTTLYWTLTKGSLVGFFIGSSIVNIVSEFTICYYRWKYRWEVKE